MKNKIYRFNEANHVHQLLVDGEWKNLTGCTTILDVLAKPALIQWSANMTARFLKDRLPEIWKMNQEEWELLLEEARRAHCKRKEKAGDYGSEVHKGIELLIKKAIKNNNGVIKRGGFVFTNKSIQNFVVWAENNEIKFLDSELHCYSEKYFLGGIVDLVFKKGGKVWIGDIKTSSSGIYPENFAQVAGYEIMLQEMKLYPKIAGYIILNLKENGEFLEKRSVSNRDNKKFFLACLEIYRQQERLKTNTIR